MFKIVDSNDGKITIIQDSGVESADYSKTSGFFDFHADGLQYENDTPSLVLFYCKNQGVQINHTAFFDTKHFETLIENDIDLLSKLSVVFVDRMGRERENSLLQNHKWTGDICLTLGDRAFLKPRNNLDKSKIPSLREISRISEKIFKTINDVTCHVHKWKNNDLIIFDNQKYLHSRVGMGIDKKRELIRICLDKC
ncbi:TauD/TfdA family dioxygenase [Mucilaginibacter gynuensis]